MTIEEAKSYGGYQIIKAAAVLLAIIEVVFMIAEIKGDFANGILFFIGGQMNIYVLSLIGLSFLTLYLLGRQAAVMIVEKNKNFVRTGFLFGFISTLLIIIYMTIAILLLNESQSPGFNTANKNEIGKMILRTSFLLLIPIIIIWLYAGRRIKIENSICKAKNEDTLK